MTRLPEFRLERPQSLADALSMLDDLGDDAQVYMGGTELLLLMKLGFAAPEVLVDCKGVADLYGVEVGDAELWSMGAGVTHRQLEDHVGVSQHLPALARLEGQIANIRVRNAGTIGGNLCFAEPHSDPSTLLAALDASVVLASSGGTRTVALADFILGPLMTVLEPGELMTRVLVPAVDDDVVVRFERLAFRERPTVNLAYVRRGARHRLVAGAVGPRPTLLTAAEDLLGDGADVAAVARAAMEQVEILDDFEGSVDYKRHLVGVLVRRTLSPLLSGAYS
jgi:carbon-monoxide dehydrogenase medium subunit